MSWKPTEGMRRADAVVDQYAKDMEQAVAFCVPQIMRSRLFDLVAVALDQALADGAEQDALNAVVGNGAAHIDPPPSLPGGFAEGHWPGPGKPGQTLTARGWQDPMPPTADPVGVDLPDFPAGEPVPLADVIARKSPERQAAIHAEAERMIDEERATYAEVSVSDGVATPAKKRGRPKGSKGKKKAKAAKKATPEQSSVIEAQAEPPAGETAS